MPNRNRYVDSRSRQDYPGRQTRAPSVRFNPLVRFQQLLCLRLVTFANSDAPRPFPRGAFAPATEPRPSPWGGEAWRSSCYLVAIGRRSAMRSITDSVWRVGIFENSNKRKRAMASGSAVGPPPERAELFVNVSRPCLDQTFREATCSPHHRRFALTASRRRSKALTFFLNPRTSI